MIRQTLRWLCWFLARYRLDLEMVCTMSKGRPMEADFHDYQDGLFGTPDHFTVHVCRRCGKMFTIRTGGNSS